MLMMVQVLILIHIATFTDISADLTMGVGFSLDYETYSFRVWGLTIDTGIPTSLNTVSGKFYASTTLGGSMSREFQLSNDVAISADILSHRFASKQFSATVGPIVLTVRPFIDFSMTITHPASSVTISASTSVGASISFEPGWQKLRDHILYLIKILIWIYQTLVI